MTDKLPANSQKFKSTEAEIIMTDKLPTNSQKSKSTEATESSGKEGDPYEEQLKDSNRPSPEKVLKVGFAIFLFIIVICSGFVARISLHILIWHTSPPIQSDRSKLGSLGGLLESNCSTCSTRNTTACNLDTSQVDESWIWAVFLVIIAPYLLTFLSTFFRICFKSNKAINWKILFVALFIETIHSVGLSILAFVILPVFDPASASVVYMSVAVIPSVLDVIDKLSSKQGTQVSSRFPLCNESKKISVIFPVIGAVLQMTGIGFVAWYIKHDLMVGLFVMASIFVSIKYWENFITIGQNSQNLNHLKKLKFELQTGRTKVTCLVSIWKIVVTFLVIIAVFCVRSNNSMDGFKFLFNHGMSTLYSFFGSQEFGQNSTCQGHVPYFIAIVTIVCDYLCYKSSKIVCVINCQRFAFSPILTMLPIVTTMSLMGLMYDPNFLKLESCDLFFSDWCLKGVDSLPESCLEILIAFILLSVSMIFITRHIWKVDGCKHGETSRIFVMPFYCGMFIDLSLTLNRRRSDKEYDIVLCTKKEDETHGTEKRKMLYACCATMWHEGPKEMEQLLKSLYRLDHRQYTNDFHAEANKDAEDVETFDFEGHIFFDDAFDPIKEGETRVDVNEYVKTLIRVMNDAASFVYKRRISLPAGDMLRTPYGARITWKLPGGNDLIVHLKDKNKIRNKKRWSQVMYMLYILKWKLQNEFGKSGLQDAAENTFLLALDGDVEFEPEAVLSLMRRMNKSKIVGAACGRIHPIGSGPMVWYQQFEYAISHWLQKATEHVIGCVLCSPGCFSLFRGSALLNSDILETYTTVASKPREHVQFDQGEDRWLCTLLLKKGWKIEYCAESDSYTFAPEGFYEFFNQRRRWTPSTLANILDLIESYKEVTKNNQNISFLYIVYHVFLFVSTLLTPGSIFMLILGAIILGFEAIPPWLALILNLIPVGIFLLLCLYASSQKQLQYAAVLSGVYVIVMVIVMIGVIRDALNEGLCSITTILLLFVAGVFVISALVHPKEFLCIIPGLLYFVAIPSMSMLMFLFSIGNLHNVSWGTRETKQKTESDSQKKTHTPEKEETGYFCSLGNFVSCIFCPTNKYTKEDFLYTQMINEVNVLVKKNENQGEDTHNKDKEVVGEVAEDSNECTDKHGARKTLDETEKEKNKDEDKHHYVDKSVSKISNEEWKFWKSKIKRYLYPTEKSKDQKTKEQEELIELRNKVSLFVYLLNAILVTVMFGLTQVNTFKDSLSISIICDNNPVSIVPIALLFAVVFGFLLLIQFLCMLYHRFSTLIHISASTDMSESNETKEAKMDRKVVELLVSPEASAPSKREPTCDKAKSIPDGNRQVLTEKIVPLKDLNAVVEANAEHLKGALYQKYQKQLVAQVFFRWTKNAKYVNDDKPGMLQLVHQAKKQKLIGHKKNKDSIDVMTEIPATKRTNGNQVKPVDSPEQKKKLSSSSISSQNEGNVRKENDNDSLSGSYNGPDTNDSNV